MEVEKIDRINALAHKAKSVGLTEEEKKGLRGYPAAAEKGFPYEGKLSAAG